jgi:hypothetical protein
MDFNFGQQVEAETLDLGNFNLDDYLSQERHFADPAFIAPESPIFPTANEPTGGQSLADKAKGLFAPEESLDADGEYMPISMEEIRARAKIELNQIVSYIETGTEFINGFLILRKGDNMTYNDYIEEKERLEAKGQCVVIEPNSELSKVLERMGKYKAQLKNSTVTEVEKKIIEDAIVADLKSQNKAKKLKRWSKWEAVANIGAAKIMPNIKDRVLEGLQSLIHQF